MTGERKGCATKAHNRKLYSQQTSSHSCHSYTNFCKDQHLPDLVVVQSTDYTHLLFKGRFLQIKEIVAMSLISSLTCFSFIYVVTHWKFNLEQIYLRGDSDVVQKSEHPITLDEMSANVASTQEIISKEAINGAAVRLLNAKNFVIADAAGTRDNYCIHCSY